MGEGLVEFVDGELQGGMTDRIDGDATKSANFRYAIMNEHSFKG